VGLYFPPGKTKTKTGRKWIHAFTGENGRCRKPQKIQTQIMKLFKTSLIALAGMVSANIAHAVLVNHDAGDLIVAFTASGGLGSGKTYLVSLNPAYQYRDAFAPIVSITNIGTDLVDAYGASWFDRTDLNWGLIGVRKISGGAENGDPNRTVYVSMARPSVATESSPISGLTGGDVSSVGADVNSVQLTFAATDIPVYVGANPNGAVVLTSATNSIDEFVPPTTINSFTSIPGSIMQSFAAGSYGNFGGSIGAVEGALDLQRLLRSTTGASPTGTIGTGSFEGTIVINSSGAISFNAVPEPSTIGLLGIGLVALAMRRRSRKNQLN